MELELEILTRDRIHGMRYYVEIAGFDNVKIVDLEKLLRVAGKEKSARVEVQFFDAKLVATWEHLYFAAMNALVAFKNRENISKNLAMESLLYASAQRQIRKAVELMGIQPLSSSVAVLVIGKRPGDVKTELSRISTYIDGRRDDTVLELSVEKMRLIQEAFEISETEFEAVAEEGGLEKALVDLVTERMALLTTMH